MNSKEATKILYDDPNSFFRASRNVALHELQGSTLKTKKPSIDDVNESLAVEAKMITLINEVEAIDTRFKWLSGNLDEVQFAMITLETTMREILKYIGLSNVSLKVIKRAKYVPQEDLQKLYSTTESIYDTFQNVKQLRDTDQLQPEIINSSTFNKMMDSISKLVANINTVIQTQLATTSSSIETRLIPQDEIPLPQEAELQEEEYIGAGRRYGASSGHYKVLSSRVREIQSPPFKRFI